MATTSISASAEYTTRTSVKPAGLSLASDRRRRLRVTGVTLGWLVPDETPDANSPSQEPWEVRVRDVSRNGVGFETSEAMNPGDTCRIRIGRGPMHLARRMRVAACHPGSAGVFVIGAEFLSKDESIEAA